MRESRRVDVIRRDQHVWRRRASGPARRWCRCRCGRKRSPTGPRLSQVSVSIRNERSSACSSTSPSVGPPGALRYREGKIGGNHHVAWLARCCTTYFESRRKPENPCARTISGNTCPSSMRGASGVSAASNSGSAGYQTSTLSVAVRCAGIRAVGARGAGGIHEREGLYAHGVRALGREVVGVQVRDVGFDLGKGTFHRGARGNRSRRRSGTRPPPSPLPLRTPPRSSRRTS
jgi:hypothetical protein